MRKPARLILDSHVIGLWIIALLTAVSLVDAVAGDETLSPLDIARRAAAEGRLTQAIGVLDRALAAGRRSPELLDLRAQLQLATGKEEAAVRDWRRAAKMDPTASGPRLALGRLYAKKGLWVDAIRMYREVLLYDPHNVDAILGLTHAFQQSGRIVGASKIIEAAAQIVEDRRIQEKWAQIALARGRPDQAEQALQRIASGLEGLPKREVIVRLAELYVSQGRYEEALSALQDAMTIKGGSEAALEKIYDLFVQATDHLVQLHVSEVETALQQFDGGSLSREEAFLKTDALRKRLAEIEELIADLQVLPSRKSAHANRLYAYSLINEAVFNALAYVDLGIPGKRGTFKSRLASAQAEMKRLAAAPTSAAGRRMR